MFCNIRRQFILKIFQFPVGFYSIFISSIVVLLYLLHTSYIHRNSSSMFQSNEMLSDFLPIYTVFTLILHNFYTISLKVSLYIYTNIIKKVFKLIIHLIYPQLCFYIYTYIIYTSILCYIYIYERGMNWFFCYTFFTHHHHQYFTLIIFILYYIIYILIIQKLGTIYYIAVVIITLAE